MANTYRIESVLCQFVEAQDYAAINCRKNKQMDWSKVKELFLVRWSAIHHGYFSTL